MYEMYASHEGIKNYAFIALSLRYQRNKNYGVKHYFVQCSLGPEVKIDLGRFFAGVFLQESREKEALSN